MKISKITDYLYVSGQPRAKHASTIQDLDIGLIISMVGQIRPPKIYRQPPFNTLWLPTFDTFLTPIPIKTLQRGVEAALPIIESGGRILTHCRVGRHRGVAMGAAILISQGYGAEAAMTLIKENRPIADPDCWYIKRRIVKFETHWREQNK
ncbi:MAG: dual specificity protein phosphatase [Chloroflexota bacterium]